RLVEVGGLRELALHVALRRHVVVAPHGVGAQALAEEGGGEGVGRPRERHRIHHALDARGDVDAEAESHDAYFLQASVSAANTRSGMSLPARPGLARTCRSTSAKIWSLDRSRSRRHPTTSRNTVIATSLLPRDSCTLTS